MHAESSSIARKRQRFRAGWVQGAELVAGASIVQTRFVAAPSVVVVVLDEPVGPAVGTGLALSLDGARRPADSVGRAGAAGRGCRGQSHVPRVRGGGGRTGGRGGRVRSGRPPRGRARVDGRRGLGGRHGGQPGTRRVAGHERPVARRRRHQLGRSGHPGRRAEDGPGQEERARQEERASRSDRRRAPAKKNAAAKKKAAAKKAPAKRAAKKARRSR